MPAVGRQIVRDSQVVAILLLIVPAALFGSDCNVAGNLVPNCGFDLGEQDWTFTFDYRFWETSGCATAPNCVFLRAYGEPYTFVDATSTCMEVSPSEAYSFGYSVRSFGPPSQTCLLRFYEYADSECSQLVSLADFQQIVYLAPDWQALRATAFVAETAHFAIMNAYCSPTPQDLFDDFFLFPAFFTDGFESEDTSAWSWVAP